MFAQYGAAVWAVWLELAPWLLLGAFIAAALHVRLPAGFMRRQLSGPAGVFKAVLFGVPLPLCSCGVIPTGLGLKKDGASDGAAVGFLISTPQTGVDSILVSASFLGWPFALFKLGSAALTGVVGGLWADRVSPPSAVEAPVAAGPEGPRTWRAGWDHGLMLLRTIAGWVVFGVLLSAAITTWLPPDLFARLNAYGAIVPFAGALLISVPLYVCATASVPIAAALVAAGMPAGAALVFLMAGPATNVATIGAVYRGFGGRVLAVYLATIIVGSVGLGWLFEAVIDAGAVAQAAAHHHTAWWAVAGAVLGAALFGWFAVDAARGWLRGRRAPAAEARETVLMVEGMTCGGCARRVEAALRAVDGVEQATVDLAAARATVRGTADPPTLIAALDAAGYPAADACETVLSVEGMTCGGCARKVESALRGVDGVDAVAVRLEGGEAVVRGRAEVGAMIGALDAAGFPATSRRAAPSRPG